MTGGWSSFRGPSVIAERDQFEAGMRDLVADSRMLFCVALVEGDDEPKVRALFEPGGSDWAVVAFLALAEVELRGMLADAVEAVEGL